MLADNDEERDDIEKCYEENEDYVMECVYKGAEQALYSLENKDADENVVKCM